MVYCFSYYYFAEERRVYYLHRYKAGKLPESYTASIVHGMDQHSTNIPNLKQISKAMSALTTVGTDLVGAIVQWPVTTWEGGLWVFWRHGFFVLLVLYSVERMREQAFFRIGKDKHRRKSRKRKQQEAEGIFEDQIARSKRQDFDTQLFGWSYIHSCNRYPCHIYGASKHPEVDCEYKFLLSSSSSFAFSVIRFF